MWSKTALRCVDNSLQRVAYPSWAKYFRCTWFNFVREEWKHSPDNVNQALLDFWETVHSSAQDCHTCITPLQWFATKDTNIQYNIVSSRITIFAPIHYPSLPWPGSMYMYSKYDTPVTRKNSVFHSTHSLQAYSKNQLLCTSNPFIPGWLSVQHASQNVHNMKSL